MVLQSAVISWSILSVLDLLVALRKRSIIYTLYYNPVHFKFATERYPYISNFYEKKLKFVENDLS